jgi:hypothetical protein
VERLLLDSIQSCCLSSLVEDYEAGRLPLSCGKKRFNSDNIFSSSERTSRGDVLPANASSCGDDDDESDDYLHCMM